MAAEDILKDLPRTEDSRRLVLQWLDESTDRERDGRTEDEPLADPGSDSVSEHPSDENDESGSTASRGGPPGAENRSTASRGGPLRVDNGSTAPQGGPLRVENGSTASRGGPRRKPEQGSTAELGGPHREGFYVMLLAQRAKILQFWVLARDRSINRPTQGQDTPVPARIIFPV